MRLGFVGCGRWSSKLAEQFRACGAEVVAYDRKTPPGRSLEWFRNGMPIPDPYELKGFGSHKPWREQLEDPRIDAIVAAADPETTTAVALACIASAKPCMATKPLMLTEMPGIRSVFYVDLFRLWGDRWKRAKETLQLRSTFEGPQFKVEIGFWGNGPMRSFPGSFDYGPHALAFAMDALGDVSLLQVESIEGRPDAELLRLIMTHSDKHPLDVMIGNGGAQGCREILLNGHTIWDEPVTLDKSGEIRAMCRSFLDDVHESRVDHYTLDLSIRGMRLLQEAREMAGKK